MIPESSLIDFSNQTKIFDPDHFGWDVHVIGAGGIGAALVPLLVALGIRRLHIYDTDRVEPHNLPSQLVYKPRHLGRFKVDAAKEELDDFGFGVEVIAHNEWVTRDTPLSGVVISGVDSMTSRQEIWRAVDANAVMIPLYMDGRVGGEWLELLAVDPVNPESTDYYQTRLWYSDKQTEELDCAARAVIHPVGELANWMVGLLTQFYRHLPYAEWQKKSYPDYYYRYHDIHEEI